MRCTGTCSCGKTCCLWEGHGGSCICPLCDAGPKRVCVFRAAHSSDLAQCVCALQLAPLWYSPNLLYHTAQQIKKAPKNRNPWGSSLCLALFLTIPTDAYCSTLIRVECLKLQGVRAPPVPGGCFLWLKMHIFYHFPILLAIN